MAAATKKKTVDKEKSAACDICEIKELTGGMVARALNEKYPVKWYGKYYIYQVIYDSPKTPKRSITAIDTSKKNRVGRVGFQFEKGKSGYVEIDDRKLSKLIYDLGNKLLKEYNAGKPKEIVKAFVGNVLYHLENMGLIIEDDIDLDLVYVNNGILDTKNGVLVESDKDTFVPIRIPVTFDKKIKECPVIDKFFNDITFVSGGRKGERRDDNGDDVMTLYEQIGYALDPEYTIRKGLMLLGPGHNGKTTYLNLLTDFLGEVNVSNISLYDFQDRFSVPELTNKLANIRDDIGHDVLGGHARSLFKEFTGGARKIQVRRIRQNPFYMRNRAKFYYAANFAPSINLNDIPFMERWVIEKLPNQFGDDDILPRKMRKGEELSGLLYQAVEAKIRLRKQKMFTKSKSQGKSELFEIFKTAKIPDIRRVDEENEEDNVINGLEEKLKEKKK